MARPSGSRTIGQATISTRKFRSRTMRRTMATCAASFCPKKAASGSTMWNSLATTVVTPRKWPGRERPSSLLLSPSTVTQVTAPAGYISSTDGANSSATPSLSRSSRSRSKLRGYFARSSLSPNCAGFTKIDAATASQEALAACTSDKCPSCSAPMVGTNPNRLPPRRAARHAARMSSTVLQILIASGRLTSGCGDPVDRDVCALQVPLDNTPASSNRHLVRFGGRGLLLYEDRHRAPVRPGGCGQPSQRAQNLLGLQDLFFVGGDAGDQTNGVRTDDEIWITPALGRWRGRVLRWIGRGDGLEESGRIGRRRRVLPRAGRKREVHHPDKSEHGHEASLRTTSGGRRTHRTTMGTSVFTAQTSA